MTKTGEPVRDGSNILYVVFHGDVVFVDKHDQNFIRVLTADNPDHVKMAGPWLGERSIPPGSQLKLFGDLTVGHGSIYHHRDRFVIFSHAPGNPTAKPYFDLVFPRPSAILPGDVVGLDPMQGTIEIIGPYGVGFDTPDGKQPAQVDLSPVFKYEFTGEVPYLGISPDPTDDLPRWEAQEGLPGEIFPPRLRTRRPLRDFAHVRMAFVMAADLLGVWARF